LLEEIGDQHRLASTLASWSALGGNYEGDGAVLVAGPFEYWFGINERAIHVSHEIGWLAGEAYAGLQAGAMLGPRGEITRALEHVIAGMTIAGRIEHHEWTLFGNWILGRINADLLDLETARVQLETALSTARRISSLFWITMTAAALGSVLVDSGELELAATHLEPLNDVNLPAASLSQRQCRLAWVRLLTARGEPARALQEIDRLIAGTPNATRQRSVPWFALARAGALEGLNRLHDAELAYDDAHKGAVDLGYRQLSWRADLALGNLWLKTGRHADAGQAFARGKATVDAIAGTIADDAARTMYLERAQAMFPSQSAASPTSTFPAGLSSRELEVLSLVAQGLTDAEVGKHLYISHRTVSRHLQSIYNKLGVSTRTAAVALAFDQGLVTRLTQA
jgi:ATP/maltotriose-dependent transcriptional regulator MalT